MSQFVGRWRAEKVSEQVQGYAEFIAVSDIPVNVQEMVKGKFAALELSRQGDKWTSKSSLEGMPVRKHEFQLGQEVESERIDGTIQIFKNTVEGNTWIEEIKPVSDPTGTSTLTKRTVNGDVMEVNVTDLEHGISMSFRMRRL